MKLFRSSSPNQEQKPVGRSAGQRLTRRSSGLAEVAKLFEADESLCVLDLGSTSAANIRYLTERGHKIYSEDLLQASTEPDLATQDEFGKPALDSKKFLADNLAYSGTQFDVVLFWNLADYMDESLVKPVIGRLWSLIRPGGVLLAFFHTREAGPDSPCYRFHIVGNDTLEMQLISARREGATSGGGFQLQRVFNNRHIENL